MSLVFLAIVCSFMYLLLHGASLLATVRPVLPLLLSRSTARPAAIPGVDSAVHSSWGAPNSRTADGQVLADSDGDAMHAGSSSPPLLTLFSTWADDKDLARNLTMLNWAQLRPTVVPVLFTNSKVQADRVRRHGWHTLPVTKTAVGVPVLKYMYRDIVKRFNTPLVAYANGDILFTESLLDTLRTILVDPTLHVTSTHLLVVGQRTNVFNVTAEEALTFKNIVRAARERGELTTPHGADYFITDRNYPWDTIFEVVIGRINYDSYLVLNAIESGHVVIDVTKTALAVHQTTEAGNREGKTHQDSRYNRDMLLKHYQSKQFRGGRTSCAPWEAQRDAEGHVIVQLRPPNIC